MALSYKDDPRAYKREYQREYRQGKRRTAPLEIRMLDKINRDGPILVDRLGPCWVWTGSRNGNGYGIISDGGKLFLAHRMSLSAALGRELAPGMFANHHCDNPPCVRPSHLYEGTAAENNRDIIQRGRHVGFRRRIFGDERGDRDATDA